MRRPSWAAAMVMVGLVGLGGQAAAENRAPAMVAKGLLLDRIVAVVDGQTVTQTELLAEARVALVRRAPADAAALAAATLPDAAFLHDFLTYLLGQMLVAREARRVGADEASEGDVDAAYGRFAARLGQARLETFMDELHVQPAFVRDVLRREQTNERYLSQRLRTRLAGLGVRQETGRDGKEDAQGQALRAMALRTFLPAYLQELRQSVEIRRLSPQGALERELRR